MELFKSFYFKVCSDFAQSKITEYLKLEGTNKDQDQPPAGLPKTKLYNKELFPQDPWNLTGTKDTTLPEKSLQ